MPNLLSERETLQRTTSIHTPQVFPSLLHKHSPKSHVDVVDLLTFVWQMPAPFPARVI